MTHPLFRRSRRQADDDQAATEHLQAIRPPADYDGRTYTFGGASAVGLDPGQVYADHGEAS